MVFSLFLICWVLSICKPENQIIGGSHLVRKGLEKERWLMGAIIADYFDFLSPRIENKPGFLSMLNPEPLLTFSTGSMV